jgi:hypothetical protein
MSLLLLCRPFCVCALARGVTFYPSFPLSPSYPFLPTHPPPSFTPYSLELVMSLLQLQPFSCLRGLIPSSLFLFFFLSPSYLPSSSTLLDSCDCLFGSPSCLLAPPALEVSCISSFSHLACSLKHVLRIKNKLIIN